MSASNKDLVFLVLQFLREHSIIHEGAMHKLEQESGLFFNYQYFAGEILKGNWDDAEKYLSGFTKIEDNNLSKNIFFLIRKHKYLEALDEHDWAKARNILVKDLKIFAPLNKKTFDDLTQLLTLDDFREDGSYRGYGDPKWMRSVMLVELKKLIEGNPIFLGKLQFPNLTASLMTRMINNSLRLQRQNCNCSEPFTLLADHICGQPNNALGLALTAEDAALANYLASASKRARIMRVPNNASSSSHPQPPR